MADLSSLVIRLSADVASLQSDLGKANAIARNSADQISGAFTKGIGQATSVVKEFAVALAAGFTVDKLVQVGKSVIDLGDNLNKMSQKVGVSVESLSSLRNAAALSDVSFEDLGGSMAKLARTAGEAAAGGKEQAAAFRLMGVSIKDASGNLKPMQTILQDVSDKFATYKDSTEKTALAQKLFGKSGAELIPLLNQLGDQGFAEVTKQAEAYNQVIGSEQAKQSEQFNDNLTRLTSAATGFAGAIVKDMLPALVRYTDDMADASKTTSGYQESAQIFANAGKSIVLAATAAKDAISALVTVVIGLGDTLGAAGDLFNGFAKAVGSDLKALGLAAQGNFSEAKAALADAGTSLADGWNTAVTRVKGAWAGVKGGVLDAVGDTAKAYDDLFGKFSNVAAGADTTAKAVRKANAPIIANADAAKEAAKAHIEYSKALLDAVKALEKLQGLSAGYQADIDDIVARMNGADDAQITYNKALRDIAESYQSLLELGPPTAEAVTTLGEATARAGERMDLTRTLDKQKDAMEKYRAELKKTQDMWGDFADAVFDAVTQSGNFLKNLLNNLKQIVTQMLKEWFRTRVIGLFTGGGGSGVGALASLGAAAIGGGGSVGGSGMAGGADFTSSAIGATQNSLFNPSSWMNAGGSLYSGFENAFSSSPTASSNLFGTYTPDYGAGTYAPSGLGYAAAGAAGIYAGYNRYQQSNGGVAGVAGAAAYGYGTYAAAIGTSAALSGGIAAGVAAIPVVGWIAIAAILIDKFSGGKLFGTKGEVKSGVSTLSIGPGGADYSTFLALKGQGALFSGAQWSTKTVAQTEEEKKAAQAFFESMTKTMAQYAEEFGVKAGDLVSAQFGQQFDKNGKPTGVTSATIAGQTYSNITPEQFSAGYVAANQLQVLSQFDDKLLDTVKAYRENIDEMVSIASGLSQAQAMFQAGGSFLAIAGDQTLSAVVELASGLQQAGETIGDTITRLIQAQAAYDSFVQQFKPATKYVDDFEAALSGINATMKANIAQANALAKAAGAAGASEKDLANIHNYAAQQAAAALKALEASAQSLAFGLGLTTVGSLDEVNQEIAALQAKAGQGSGAIKGFGNAISDAASRATAAMNLLLGSLSPLNDQQKLQTALGGLRSGTATVDQVLEIGRRLYASSQAYTDLFNSVKGYAGRGTGSPTGGAGGGTGATSGGLSGAERERLADLLAEQQQLQAAATLTQYQTLAQQIAEIASAKGEDWRTVLEQMGISVDKFEAGLQLTDAGTNDLIASIQAQLDDNGENTTILADLLKQILVALGGTPTDDSTTPQAPTSGQGLPQQIGGAVESAFNRSLDRSHSMHSRSARPQVPA